MNDGLEASERRREIVLVDDHTIVRHAIKTILEATGRYTIVGEAGDADEALQLLMDTRPDLVVLDLGLPNKSGMEVLYELKRKKIETKVVILTMYEDENKIKQAMRGGASSYVLKNTRPDEFIAAVEKALAGEIFLPKPFEHLLSSLESGSNGNGAQNDRSYKDSGDPLEGLSPREREMFFLLAEGMPNRVIAKKLFISPRTVETHRARVIKKLGFKSNADLIRYAIRSGLIVL